MIASVLFTMLCFQSKPAKPSQPDTLWQGIVAKIPVRVIKINLKDPRVKISVQTAPGFPGGVAPMNKMIAATRPDIAINGSYFSKTTGIPIGDVVIRGQKVNTGNMGTVMAITEDKQVLIRRVPFYKTMQWPGYVTVLGCGPALVLDSKVDVMPEEEHFQDPHIMGTAARMGVGVRPDNTLLFVNTKKGVSFRKWAEIMRELGCRDAYNLDAGASLGMYYRGKTIITPGRQIASILCVWISRPMPQFADLCPPPGALKPAFLSGSSSSRSFPTDLGNSTHPKAKLMTICGDTMLSATELCPTTIKRRIAPGKILKRCQAHKAR